MPTAAFVLVTALRVAAPVDLDQGHELAGVDPRAALASYRAACANGDGEGCLWAASMGMRLGLPDARVARWTRRGVVLADTACTSGDHAVACGLLAASYAYGWGVPSDRRMADHYASLAGLPTYDADAAAHDVAP